MIAVIFEVEPRPGKKDAYLEIAARLRATPVALTVRVITAAIGFATVVVSVRASSSSTQENMKQKKAVTPMPVRISGMNTVRKKRGKE